MEEEKIFGLKNILLEIGFSKSPREIEIKEEEMLSDLQWKLNLTTPIELTRLLLYYSNNTFDFSNICQSINNFIFLSLIGKSPSVLSKV